MLASADKRGGVTEAVMLARGFTAEMLVSLVHSGFATASAETAKIGGRSIEVCRMRMSAAGRYFLSNSRECAPEKIHVAPRRSWNMQQRCYSYRVPDTATEMVPFCRPGDDITVCPVDKVELNKHVVLYKHVVLCDLEETRCLVRYLAGETATHWVVEQCNPRGRITLNKSEWPTVKKICGVKFNQAAPGNRAIPPLG